MNKQQLNKLFNSGATNNSNISQNVLDEFEPDFDDNLPAPAVVPGVPSAGLNETDLMVDIDFTRRVLTSLAMKSQQLADVALENASDSEHPRNIEVAATAISTAAAVAEKLIDLNKKYKELSSKSIDTGTGNTFINNNQTINISSADLLRQLEEDEDIYDDD